MTEVTVTPSSGAVEEGDQVLVVQDTEEVWLDEDTWDELDGPDDDSAQGDPTGKYRVEFKVKDGDDFTLQADWWLNDYNLGPNSGLGALLSRWGLVTDFADQEGETLELDDVFAPGREFKARVRQQPDGDYMEIDDVTIAGHDDDDFPDDEKWGASLEPVDADEIQAGDASDDSGEDTGDQKADVYEIIGNMDEPSEGELTSKLAQENGSLVPVMKDMMDDGELVIEQSDDGDDYVAIA